MLSEREVGIEILIKENIGWTFGGNGSCLVLLIPATTALSQGSHLLLGRLRDACILEYCDLKR